MERKWNEMGSQDTMKRINRRILPVLLLGALLLCSCAGKDEGQQASGGSAEAGQVEQQGQAEAGASQGEAAGDRQPGPGGALADGSYKAEFSTDSTMFRVNEACEGLGTLTVQDGQMTIHVSLQSKNIVNLYPGLAADAAKEGAELLEPTEDTVTYSDGWTEEVYGFDIPVPALDTEFDLALIGKKGKWYDHKVKVANPVQAEAAGQEAAPAAGQRQEAAELADGSYRIEITFEGGTGRAGILSPVSLQVADGKATARIQWDSPNYDYMLVDGEKYLPVNQGGDSVFEIPVLCFDEPMEVIGDTLAMSTPHEVEYTITFHSDTIRDA